MGTPQTGLRVGALVAVLCTVVFSATYSWLMPALGAPVADMRVVTDAYANLLTPAPYAFAIWGLIYAALIAYAIGALLPSQRDRAVHDRIAPWLTVATVLSSVWIASYTALRSPTMALRVMPLILFAAVAMYRHALGAVTEGRLARVWLAPFSLFLGWISIATIANVTLALVERGRPGNDVGWATVMLGIAVLLAVALALRARDAIFSAVVAWASFAIAVSVSRRNDAGDFGDVAIAAAIVTSVIAVGLVLLRARELLLGPDFAPRSLQAAFGGAAPRV